MKTKIQLIVFIITLLGLNINAQTLKDLAKKANQAAKIASNIKNTADKIESNAQVLILKDASSEYKISVLSDETYCGLSQEKTKRYNLNLKYKNESKQIIGFVDGLNCVTEASEQWKNNKDMWSDKSIGKWEIGFLTNPKNSSFIFCHILSDAVLSVIYPNSKDQKAFIPFRKFSLKGDSIYLLTTKTIEELNKNEIGKYYCKFSDGKIINKDNEEMCSYEGGNKYLLMKMWFAFDFYLHDYKIAESLKSIANKKTEENKAAQNKQYVEKTKNCKYCNQPYTGESFDFYSYRSRDKPCADKIYKVYYDAFCSQKCALDHCKATH
jgi:hypothetical protein